MIPSSLNNHPAPRNAIAENVARNVAMNSRDAGRFQLKTGTSERKQHAYTQARFTPKGMQWVAGLWAEHQMGRAA